MEYYNKFVTNVNTMYTDKFFVLIGLLIIMVGSMIGIVLSPKKRPGQNDSPHKIIGVLSIILGAVVVINSS